ncbi:MAG: ferredoxin--NADP reductase [Legionellales bacterium]|nr:ferredoxin--NADP reductase [Legionellales bacterium]
MQKPVFTLKLLESKMLTSKVKHFSFQITDNPEFKFIPGQFISLHFNKDDGQPIKRSYSIATIHEDKPTDIIEFAATFVEEGPGAKFLFNLQQGDAVMASGPYGKLILDNQTLLPKRYIFIGTGTGITPYRSMLNRIADNLKDQNHSTIILQGVQNPDELLYPADFLRLTDKFTNYKFRAYYSRHKNLTSNYEFTGYVQKAFDDINLDKDNDMIYLCGNPYMIEEIVGTLKNMKFESKRIFREKYYSKKSKI